MSSVRDEVELRQARRALFDVFPCEGNAREVWQFQKLLIDELLNTERELTYGRLAEQKHHLHLVRIYGDALVSTQLSTYALRQLARNNGKPPHLSGQGKAFDLAKKHAEEICAQGAPAVLSDLTNVLKNGDLVVCADPNLPTIIECKLSKARDYRFERQGRRGRQLARQESIASFLQKGRGRIFGEETERITIELTTTPEFSFDVIDRVVADALDHRPMASVVSDNDLISAALLGESPDIKSALSNWYFPPGERFAVGSSLDRLQTPWPDVTPPMLWNVAREARWALMEGDVSITHVVRVGAFVGMHKGGIRVLRVIEMPGAIPWGYEVMVGDELLTVGAKVVCDVIYNHETIESAGNQLLECAEKWAAAI